MISKIFSFKVRIHSFGYAGEGLSTFFRSQSNAWIHLGAAAVTVALGIWLQISKGEWVSIAFCIGLVFGAELLNSAIEFLADHVTPEQHAQIKKVKDLAAAAVLVIALTALAIGLLIFLPRLF